MTNRPTIAVDLDDVLAPHASHFIDFSNKHYQTTLTLEVYHERWAELWEVDQEETDRRSEEFYTQGNLGEMAVFEEAQRVLKNLVRSYNLYIVTARSRLLIPLTLEWAERHFPNIFRDIHFVPIWEPDNTVTKADICREIGTDYFIDDLPRHCNLTAQGGIKTILFGNYNWNRHPEIHPNITRCNNWQEVEEYFAAQKIESRE